MKKEAKLEQNVAHVCRTVERETTVRDRPVIAGLELTDHGTRYSSATSATLCIDRLQFNWIISTLWIANKIEMRSHV